MGLRRKDRKRVGGDDARRVSGRAGTRRDDGRPARGLRRLVRNLTGRAERDLVDGLLAQVSAASTGARLAHAVTRGDLPTEDARTRMTAVEHDGDRHRRDVVDILSHSFTTPIDREDLFRLSRSIDDVLDNLRDFVREYDLFEWGADALLAEVVLSVDDGVTSLGDAVRHLGEDGAAVPRAALSVRKNDIRQRYQSALADVLSQEVSSGTLKRRELLRRLDVVGLRLGEAADALADGAVKRSH